MSVFFKRSITLKTYVAGSRDPLTGRGIPGSYTESTINVDYQPLNGRELDSLPEGRRGKQSFKVYSDTKYKTIKEIDTPDRFIIDSDEYEIINREPWQFFLNHYKYIAQLVNE